MVTCSSLSGTGAVDDQGRFPLAIFKALGVRLVVSVIVNIECVLKSGEGNI